jgi:hypothetical protein
LSGGGGSSSWTSSGNDISYVNGYVAIGTPTPSAQLEISAPDPTNTTITSSGTTVTGVGTAFLTLFRPGDKIVANGQALTITSITSNTSLTTASAFTPALASASSFSRIGAILRAGNVGIGLGTPLAALDVTGQVVARTFDNGSSTTFDLNKGNIQYTSANCGAMTIKNMVDGGSYTLVVQGATSGLCTFTDSTGGRTFRFSPTNSATTPSSHTLYSMQVVGNNVYVSWISGF